jgi:nitrogen regulatory protein PII 1
MKLVRAIIRPDREEAVVDALEAAGIVSLTKMDVLGRGQQRGIQVGPSSYDELPKVQLMVVVEDAKVDAAVAAIERGAKTGQHGDGKIFIGPVEAAYTIRTGQRVSDAAPVPAPGAAT